MNVLLEIFEWSSFFVLNILIVQLFIGMYKRDYTKTKKWFNIYIIMNAIRLILKKM